MVNLLTEYTTQIYHALSTDARPDADPGDQLREIDTGKRFIFDGTSWNELPDGGGGGGGGASYTELSAVSMVNNSTNGYYNMLRLYANAGLRRIEFSFKNLVNVSSILVCSSAAGHGASPGDPYISVSGVHGDASIISQQVVDGYTEINANISISSPRVINLGAWFGSSTYAGTNAFKYFRLYDADENLLYNLIPVLDNNSRPCFYDLVSKSFHYNDSMLEFVAGEAV